MSRTLRVVFCICLLGSGLLPAQEAARMNGAQAVRFEQSPGFFNYVVFCKTPKEFMAQMPSAKLPAESMEYGLCWYVRGSMSRGNAVPPEAEGRLVISPGHVRFMPNDPQSAAVYADLRPDHVELKHDQGQPYGILRSGDLAFRFQFSKLCLACAPGTPTPPGLVPALTDQEFTILRETIQNFYSAWRQIYRLSSGQPPAGDSAKQAADAGASVADHREAVSKRMVPKPGSVAEVKGGASVQANSSAIGAEAARTDSSIAVKPSSVTMRTKPVKITSGAAVGLLVKKVAPAYPLDAKLLRLEGTVMLRAVIERTGEVAEVYALSGPPLLESAAVDAVRQWQYRPYAVNGQPVDVETTIEVVFALDGSHSTARAQK